MPKDLGSVENLVIGAGFGGLGAALRLVECGRDVTLLEAMNYPGGCASTFKRDGFRFESGATLFSGFGKGQIFEQWIQQHRLNVEIDWIDPLVEFRSDEFSCRVGRDRSLFWRQFLDQPGAPKEKLRAFAEAQEHIADTLWSVLENRALWPPLNLGSIPIHLKKIPSYLRLSRWIGRPLIAMLDHYGLADFSPLRLYVDAVCQITLQTDSTRAETPFALGAMDYYFRGTGHVRHGISSLADELLGAIGRLGGNVLLSHRAQGIRRTNKGWEVTTPRGRIVAKRILINALPSAISKLVPEVQRNTKVDDISRELRSGWGACMIYAVVNPSEYFSQKPHHLQIVQDPRLPLMKGNHLFASLSGPDDLGRSPRGTRTLTVSTHVPMSEYLELTAEDRKAYVEDIQSCMDRGLERFAPDLCQKVLHRFPASPRTFERFTLRPNGCVGGIPRHYGMRHYIVRRPKPLAPNLYAVGDTHFPGQSTFAASSGGAWLVDNLIQSGVA